MKKLNKAIDIIISRLEKTEKFVLEQAPQVCKEILAEKLALLKFSLIVSSLITSLFITGIFVSLHQVKADWNNSMIYFLVGILSLLTIIPLVFLVAAISEAISLKTAPKLTLLREFKRLGEKE